MEEVTISDVMRAFANDAVYYANHRLNVVLDFSEASLKDIDRILEDFTKGELVLPDNLSEAHRDALWTFCKMMGGYVGEVIIRNLGGQWQTRDKGDGAVCIHLVAAGDVDSSPPDAVWRALTEPFKGSIVSYYDTLRGVLGHGQQTTEGRGTFVRLPPLSDQPRTQGAPEKRPWWRFW
jgi:hypothetical protein